MANIHKTTTMTSVTSALSTLAAAGSYCGDLESKAVGVFGTFSGTLAVEESPDGTNWYPVGATLTAAGYRELSSTSQFVRLNASAWTSGTAQATLAGQQRTSNPARFEAISVDSYSSAGGAAGTSDAKHVAHLEDATVWVTMPSAATAVAQYSGDGTTWIAVSTVASTVSNAGGTGKWNLPTHALQARVNVTAIVSGGSAQIQMTGHNLRAGAWNAVTASTLTSATSTAAYDITDMRAPRAYMGFVGAGASATVVIYGSPEGTNWYEVCSQLSASGSRAIPAWVQQVKGVVLGHSASTLSFVFAENAGERTDKGGN